MITVTLDKIKHKGKQVLLLKFPYNNQLKDITKQLPKAGATQCVSQTHTRIVNAYTYIHKRKYFLKQLYGMKKETDIKLFEDKKVRTLWNEEDEKWYLSIVDVIAVLTDSPNPRKY